MRARMPHKLVDAIGQGLTAHREYERLMSMGMRHDPALRAALCISAIPTGGPIATSRARSAARTAPGGAARSGRNSTASLTNGGLKKF